MQKLEVQENYREWLRDKGKNTYHYKVQCDVQSRTGTKDVGQKYAKGEQSKKVVFIILNLQPEAIQ